MSTEINDSNAIVRSKFEHYSNNNKSFWPWIKLFLIFGVFYPLLRVELIDRVGIPSEILGSWVDLVSLTLLIKIIIKKSAPLYQLTVSYAVLLLLLAGFLSVKPSGNLLQTAYGIRQTYLPIVYFYIGLNFGSVWGDVLRLWRLLVNIFGASATAGLVLTYAVPEYWISLYTRDAANTRDWGLNAIAREGGLRMTGAILDPVVFGTLCAFGSILSLSAFMVARDRKRIIVNFVTFAVSITGVIFSLSRGAWLDAALGLGICLCFNIKLIRTPRVTAILFFVLALAAGIFINESKNGVNELIRRTTEKTVNEGNLQREGQIDNVLQKLKVYPMGMGLGNVGHIGERFSINGLTGDGYDHITDCWYLKLLAEGGLPLFLTFSLYLIISFSVLLLKIVKCQQPQQRAFLSALVSIQAVSIVQATVSNIWDLFYLSQLLWLFGGLAVALNPKPIGRLVHDYRSNTTLPNTSN